MSALRHRLAARLAQRADPDRAIQQLELAQRCTVLEQPVELRRFGLLNSRGNRAAPDFRVTPRLPYISPRLVVKAGIMIADDGFIPTLGHNPF